MVALSHGYHVIPYAWVPSSHMTTRVQRVHPGSQVQPVAERISSLIRESVCSPSHLVTSAWVILGDPRWIAVLLWCRSQCFFNRFPCLPARK